MKRFSTHGILIASLLGALGACSGAQAPGNPSPGVGKAVPSASSAEPAQQSAVTARKSGEPYRLNRIVYRVEIDPIPPARTRCLIYHDAPPDDSPEARVPDSQMVEWDPTTDVPPIRRVALFGRGVPKLRCNAEVTSVGGEKSDLALSVSFMPKSTLDGGADSVATLTGRIVNIGGADAGAGKWFRDIDVSVYREEHGDPELGGSDALLSRSRSLDPITPIATELAKVVAEVAMERAKSSATESVRLMLKGTICQLKYSEPGSAAVHAPNEDGDDGKMFRRVCGQIDMVRIEEIAASSTVIARALAGDVLEYALRTLRSSLGAGNSTDPELVRLVDPMIRLAEGLLEGTSSTNEKDVQALLIELGRIPMLPVNPGQSPPRAMSEGDGAKALVALAVPIPNNGDADWRCAVGMGFAVVRECLRRGPCSPETIRANLEREISAPSESCKDVTKSLLTSAERGWPDLPSVLAKSVDVFRPPPGATPNRTAKLATNIMLDVLKQRLTMTNQNANSRERVEEARGILNAVFDRDYLAASIAAAGFISNAIHESCPSADAGTTPCKVDLTEAKLHKSIAVLNAFISYASSYQEKLHDGVDTKTDGEREKLRHDERKKAMELLIEATTNRANRGRDVLFSIGVGVGFSVNARYVRSAGVGGAAPMDERWLGAPQLALPMGFAMEYLPATSPSSAGQYLGFHLQAVLFDLGQFATWDGSEGSLAKPTEGSWLSFGLKPALMLGNANHSVLFGGQLGYAPGMKLDETRRPGGLYAGGFIGTYVPFFDFN